MRVLLSDGSGLTARQVATQLSESGHRVEVLSPDPLALTRFTRHVAKVHKVPAYGIDPFGWLEEALVVHQGGHFDVLLPTQEQVAVLAVTQPPVATAVPDFKALAQVQDKIAADATLAGLSLPQPTSLVVDSAEALETWNRFPAFAKAPIGTATSGVRQIHTPNELRWKGEPFLLQESVAGPLVMAQSVFDHGRLVAFAANLRVREGSSGGASHKRSLDLPLVRKLMDRLGGHLRWHGALSADLILAPEGPTFIDINPRLVEPGNARRAGVDLVGALLDIALCRSPAPQPIARPDVATHQLILAVLGAAEFGRGRKGVAHELVEAARHTGSYADSVEELTPFRHDLRAAIPVIAAAALTLLGPLTWRFFSSGAVSNYALSTQGWDAIVAHAGRQ